MEVWHQQPHPMFRLANRPSRPMSSSPGPVTHPSKAPSQSGRNILMHCLPFTSSQGRGLADILDAMELGVSSQLACLARKQPPSPQPMQATPHAPHLSSIWLQHPRPVRCIRSPTLHLLFSLLASPSPHILSNTLAQPLQHRDPNRMVHAMHRHCQQAPAVHQCLCHQRSRMQQPSMKCHVAQMCWLQCSQPSMLTACFRQQGPPGCVGRARPDCNTPAPYCSLWANSR